VHYKLGANIIVRTENAAKPDKQSSTYLNSLISNLEHVCSSFDYGCGKLRYKDVMLRTTDTLALVDSEVQLARDQMICGKFTTIRTTVQRSNRIATYNTTEFARLSTQFDRGFCINVLSVIPILATRRRVLHFIRGTLRSDGTCLFVVQYRNSDFTRMRSMPNARPWRDGFLVDSLRGYSFYGLISPERLGAMILKAGFKIEKRMLNEGSVYLLARSPQPTGRIVVMEEEPKF
jgi:hypothetical protein